MADESFLLSRQTSAATMALTTSTGRDSNPIINSAHPPLMFNLPSFWRQEPMVELHLPPDTQVEDENQLNICHPQGLLDTLDYELLFPDSHHFASQDRPSSSRSHLRVWRRNRSPDVETSKTPRGSSEDPDLSDSFDESNRPSMLITRNEYEALPPTIQRKVSQACIFLFLKRHVPYVGCIWRKALIHFTTSCRRGSLFFPSFPFLSPIIMVAMLAPNVSLRVGWTNSLHPPFFPAFLAPTWDEPSGMDLHDWADSAASCHESASELCILPAGAGASGLQDDGELPSSGHSTAASTSMPCLAWAHQILGLAVGLRTHWTNRARCAPILIPTDPTKILFPVALRTPRQTT